MATYNVDGVQGKVSELVNRALSGEKITISTQSGNVVMVGEEDWDSLVEALSVMMLPEVRDRILCQLSDLSEKA